MNLNLDFAAILERWPAFLEGALLTLQLAFIATVLGAVIGVLGAIGRRSNHPIDLRASAASMSRRSATRRFWSRSSSSISASPAWG